MAISAVAAQAASLVTRADALLPEVINAAGRTGRLADVRSSMAALDGAVAPLEQSLAAVLPEPVRDHLRVGRGGLSGPGAGPTVDHVAAYRAGVGGLRAAAAALDATHPGAATASLQSLDGAESVFAANLLDDARSQLGRAGAMIDSAQAKQGGFLKRAVLGAGSTPAKVEYARGLVRSVRLEVGRYGPAGALTQQMYESTMAEQHGNGLWEAVVNDRGYQLESAKSTIVGSASAVKAMRGDAAKLAGMGARAQQLRAMPAAAGEQRIQQGLRDVANLPGLAAGGDEAGSMRAIAAHLEAAKSLYEPTLEVSVARDGVPGREAVVNSASARIGDLVTGIERSPGARLLPEADLVAMDGLRRSAGTTAYYGYGHGSGAPDTERAAKVIASFDELAARIRGYAEDASPLDRGRADLFAPIDAFGARIATQKPPASSVRGAAATANRWRELANLADSWRGSLDELAPSMANRSSQSRTEAMRANQYSLQIEVLARQANAAAVRALPADLLEYGPTDRIVASRVASEFTDLARDMHPEWTGSYAGKDPALLSKRLSTIADHARSAAAEFDHVAATLTPEVRAAQANASAAAAATLDIPALRTALRRAQSRLDSAEDIGRRAGAVDRALPRYAASLQDMQGVIAAVADQLPPAMVDGMQARATTLSGQVAKANDYLAENQPGLLRRTMAKISAPASMMFNYLPEDLYPQRGIAGQVRADMGALDSMLDVLGDLHATAAAAPDVI